jgi:hypothetical protein
MAFVDAASLNRLSRDCSDQGYYPLYTTGSLGVSTTSNGNANLAGLTAPLTVFPWMASDILPAQEYHQAIATYAPGTAPSSDGAIGWTSALAFTLAARRAGPDITPQSLIAALATFHDETLGGASVPLTFAAGVDHPPSSCYFKATMTGSPLAWTATQGSRLFCP